MYLLILSFLLLNGDFHLHIEDFGDQKACKAKLEVVRKQVSEIPEIFKAAVDCIQIREAKGV